MKILFCVLWYFAIAFATMIALVKFKQIANIMGDEDTPPIPIAIINGLVWPCFLLILAVVAFFRQLAHLLSKIEDM